VENQRNVQLSIMGESVHFEGFLDHELAEVFEWFAGAIDPRVSSPALTIRMLRCESLPELPPPLETSVRHRANIRPGTRFLDGTVFDQRSQIRDVSTISDGSTLCCQSVPGAVLLSTREVMVVLARESPPLLLADILENWLLWRAREAGQVMAHASGWLRDGQIEMFVGSSGDGKTTELLRRIAAGAPYFANDRIALRVDGQTLWGRSFPEPINIGAGTIRSLGLDLPTFGLDDLFAIRLLAADVAARWHPDFHNWYPVAKIYSRSRASYDANVYWHEDPEHPFWIRALRPRPLANRAAIEAAMSERFSLAESSVRSADRAASVGAHAGEHVQSSND
jgi:hypothetical protein